MLLLFVLVSLCHLNCSELKGWKCNAKKPPPPSWTPEAPPTGGQTPPVGIGESLTSLKNKWYGPSYQPTWWSPNSTIFLRGSDFAYNVQASWPATFEDCGGRRQSPINIETSSLKRRKTRRPLKWENYNKVPKRMVLENSLHSIHANGVWKNSSNIPYITKGPLEKRYYFSQLHFHWGETDDSGSEHTINSKRYPLEMHVVHDRRVEDPTNLSEEGNSDSLVVVSYMFEIVSKDNPGLNPILDGIPEVQGDEKKKTNIRPFPLEDLIEPFARDYATYRGSLTTPPCTEGVVWLISSKALGISDRQMSILRSSVTDDNSRAISNYRQVQKLNGRNIYYVYC